MEIELTTSKKRLTKSIVNQMKSASSMALKHGKTIGYVINIKKNAYKATIVKYDDEYFIISNDYVKDEITVHRRIGSARLFRRFKTGDECDEWWENYQQRIKEATTQIYI